MLKATFQFLKELYLAGFILGFRFRAPKQLGGGWGPVVDAGKGVGFVCLIEFFILKGIESNIEIHFGTRFLFLDSTNWTSAAIITLALYLPNYYFLVTRGHGIAFEREFNHLNKFRKALLLVSCSVLALTTIVFCIYSDSAYRHFFHIIPNS